MFTCKFVCPVFLPVFFPVIEIDCSMSAGTLLVLMATLGLSCAFRDNVVQLPRSRIRRSPIRDHHAQLGLEPLDADVNVFLTTTPLGATPSLNLLREYCLSRSRPELPYLSYIRVYSCVSSIPPCVLSCYRIRLFHVGWNPPGPDGHTWPKLCVPRQRRQFQRTSSPNNFALLAAAKYLSHGGLQHVC